MPAEIRIPLSSPDITEPEIERVVEVLRSGRLSLGPYLPEFERAVARYAGTRHAVAVNSGTSGLHLALLALGIGAGDEVLTSPFSFIASANAILLAGARPVFVDIDPHSLNIDPTRLERAVTERTRAILLVHIFGRPAPLGPIQELARRRGLALIEDACEALGAEHGGRKLGACGDAGVYAFYPNKPITTGEGGVVVTDREDLARAVSSLRNQGRDPDDSTRFESFGYSLRLTELQCALGVGQMRRIEEILERRAQVARWYDERLRGQDGLVLPEQEVPDGRVSWFVYVVRLAERCGEADRDRVVRGLGDRGIGCARYFPPIHLQPFYRREFGHRAGDFPLTERAAARTLALPFSGRMKLEQIDEVCATLVDLLPS